MSDRTSQSARFGVFYDGGWFSHLWVWAKEALEWKAAPRFLGVHEALRWYLHNEMNLPLAQVNLVCAHYVLGKADDANGSQGRQAYEHWDTVLERSSIQRQMPRCAAVAKRTPTIASPPSSLSTRSRTAWTSRSC